MSFEQEVANFVIKADGLQEKQVRYLCLDLFKGVIMGTPVDTGRARGNWQASVGAPAQSELSTTDKNGGKTIGAGSQAVSKAVGNVFYISNNLPYMYRLEFEGWSNQAPSGWVRTAIERTKQIAARMPRR